MSFESPEFFWLSLFLLAGFIKNDFKEIRFVGFAYILTFVFIIIALSRPVIEQEPIKSEQIYSDAVVAIDLSYSMHADDIQPTRLTKAKEILNELVHIRYNSRFGILGFTTNAIVLSPLTKDTQLLLHLFSSIDENLIITKGSSILPALKLARKMSKSKKLSVVILSDGTDELDYTKEITYAKENNLVVNIFMLATKMGGTLLLENGELLKDSSGDIVVSRENEKIAQLSDATGGVYTKNIDDLLSALKNQEKQEFKAQTTIVKNIELFYYFVLLSILSFLLAITSLKKYFITLLLLFGVSLEANILEYFEDENIKVFKEANKLYKNGEYEKALNEYQKVKSNSAEFKSRVYFNIANSLVRQKEFKKARENYLKSLTLSYSKEADENLQFIKNVAEEKIMKTGQQKTNKKSLQAKKEEGEKTKKEGGGSNMKVSAKSSDGAGKMGKKTKSNPMLSLDSSKAKLSSKQYELINKGVSNEKTPW